MLDSIGRDDWIRTSDPLTPSQVRYQAALHPDRYRTSLEPERSERRALGTSWNQKNPVEPRSPSLLLLGDRLHNFGRRLPCLLTLDRRLRDLELEQIPGLTRCA